MRPKGKSKRRPKGKSKMSELEYTEQGFRLTTDTKRHHRTRAWDYTGEGIYHFTLSVAERYPLFGQLEGDSPEDARIALSPFGQLVKELLRDEPRYYGEKGYSLKMLATQIMPDHIHIALQVLAPLPKSIGTVVRGFKSACTSLYKRVNAANGRKHATKGEIEEASIRDIAGENDILFSRIFTRIGSIWQPDPAHYYDRIIHSYDQIDHLINYIKDNPRRLWLKRANPDLFRIRQDLLIGESSYTGLGNIFLADHPQKEALHCSRSLSQTEIDALRDKCLDEAANGTVYVSAAISEGEKQICRALREAGFPLVVLLAEGFPAPDSPHHRYFKPQGVYFEACAAGKLLLLEPAAEAFERSDIEAKVFAKTGPIPHESKRYRFVALNHLAEEIAQSFAPSLG